jgi:hypothetical protein
MELGLPKLHSIKLYNNGNYLLKAKEVTFESYIENCFRVVPKVIFSYLKLVNFRFFKFIRSIKGKELLLKTI